MAQRARHVLSSMKGEVIVAVAGNGSHPPLDEPIGYVRFEIRDLLPINEGYRAAAVL